MSEVRVILDTSALLAYSRLEGLAVGELLAMLEEDDGQALVGIPAVSYLAAHRALDDPERALLRDLATRTEGVVVLLPLLGAHVVETADLDTVMATDGMAHAVLETRAHDATLATYALAAAAKELPADAIIDLGMTW